MTQQLTAYLTSRYLGWTLIVLVAWTLLPHLLRLIFARELNWRALARAPEWGLFVGILAVLAVIYRLDESRAFFSEYSDESLIHNVALFSVLSIGAAIVIIAGGIDLSVGSVVALTSVVAAQLMTDWLPNLPRLESAGASRLVTASLASSLVLGLWSATRPGLRRPWTVGVLSLALALAIVLELGMVLGWWDRPPTFGIPTRALSLGVTVSFALLAQAIGLVGSWRAGRPSSAWVPGSAFALSLVAGLAPFAQGSGPLLTWGGVANLALVLLTLGLTLLVGLALGLRRGAAVLTVLAGLIVALRDLGAVHRAALAVTQAVIAAVRGLGLADLLTTLGLDTIEPQSVSTFVSLIAPTIVLTLLLGLLIGLMHAVMINSLKLPAFIATLATLAGLRSLALILGNNRSINVEFAGFRNFGKENVYTVSIFAVIALLTSLLMGASVLGRHLYALGGNEAAARLSGLPTRRLKSVAYGLSGLLAALGGLLFLGNTGSVQPATTGATYELYAITAAVVGGCSLAGGVGSIRGTVLGLILIQIVIKGTGIVVRGIDSTQIEGLVLGTVVVLAVGFNERFRVRRL